MFDNMNLNMKDNILSLNQHRKTPPKCVSAYNKVLQGISINHYDSKNLRNCSGMVYIWLV